MNTRKIIQDMLETGIKSAPLREPIPNVTGFTKPIEPEQLQVAKEMAVLDLANKLADWKYFLDPFTEGSKLTPQEEQEKALFRYDLIPILNEGLKVTAHQEDGLFAEKPANPNHYIKFELSGGMFKNLNPFPTPDFNQWNRQATPYIDLDAEDVDCVLAVLNEAEFAPVPVMENAPFTDEEVDCFKTRVLEVCKEHMVQNFRDLLSNNYGPEDIELNVPKFEDGLEKITPALTELLEFRQDSQTVGTFKVYGMGHLEFNPKAPEILPKLIEQMNMQQGLEMAPAMSRRAKL